MFKFVFSCQPLYYYIHKVLKRCPTERYIKPVRIPGYLWYDYEIFFFEILQSETFFSLFIYILHLSNHGLVEQCTVAISF